MRGRGREEEREFYGIKLLLGKDKVKQTFHTGPVKNFLGAEPKLGTLKKKKKRKVALR